MLLYDMLLQWHHGEAFFSPGTLVHTAEGSTLVCLPQPMHAVDRVAGSCWLTAILYQDVKQSPSTFSLTLVVSQTLE